MNGTYYRGMVLFAVVATIVVLAFVGYVFYKRRGNPGTTERSTTGYAEEETSRAARMKGTGAGGGF